MFSTVQSLAFLIFPLSTTTQRVTFVLGWHPSLQLSFLDCCERGERAVFGRWLWRGRYFPDNILHWTVETGCICRACSSCKIPEDLQPLGFIPRDHLHCTTNALLGGLYTSCYATFSNPNLCINCSKKRKTSWSFAVTHLAPKRPLQNTDKGVSQNLRSSLPSKQDPHQHSTPTLSWKSAEETCHFPHYLKHFDGVFQYLHFKSS